MVRTGRPYVAIPACGGSGEEGGRRPDGEWRRTKTKIKDLGGRSGRPYVAIPARGGGGEEGRRSVGALKIPTMISVMRPWFAVGRFDTLRDLGMI